MESAGLTPYRKLAEEDAQGEAPLTEEPQGEPRPRTDEGVETGGTVTTPEGLEAPLKAPPPIGLARGAGGALRRTTPFHAGKTGGKEETAAAAAARKGESGPADEMDPALEAEAAGTQIELPPLPTPDDPLRRAQTCSGCVCVAIVAALCLGVTNGVALNTSTWPFSSAAWCVCF